jgi:formylglycine-generating enzyme required for sulfatase activity/predicted  nucleic acid-binding Zn-ribbon protein
MAKIIAGCKHCGHLFKIEELFEGIDVECPKCGQMVVVSKVADRDEHGLPVFSEDMDEILDKIYERADEMEGLADMDQLEKMAETLEMDQEAVDQAVAARATARPASRKMEPKKPPTKYKIMRPKKSMKKLIALGVVLAIVIAGIVVAWSIYNKQKQFQEEAEKLYTRAQGQFDVREYGECLQMLKEFDQKYRESDIAPKAATLNDLATVEYEAKNLMEEAKKLRNENKLREAIAKIGLLVSGYTDSKLLAEAKQLEKAWSQEKALADAKADYQHAEAFYGEGKYAQALPKYERLARGNWQFSGAAKDRAAEIRRYQREAQELFDSAQEARRTDNYKTALSHFKELLERFPHSKAAPLAQKAIPETQQEQKDYIDSNFKKHVDAAKRFEAQEQYRRAWEEFQEARKWKPQDLVAKKEETRLKRMARLFENMIKIPAGPFTMGSKASDSDETPEHTVELREYRISKYPVTNEEYKRFVDVAGHRVPYVKAEWAKPYNWDRDRKTFPPGKGKHPVVLVSYDDAKAYCKWIGKRLPTEAQWEKAARGQNGLTYPWGPAPPNRRLCNFSNIEGGTTAVGSYQAGASRAYGMEDMAGNVWEWCADSYKKDFYRAPGRGNNPECRANTGLKVIRGGCWTSKSDVLRCSNRHSRKPDTRHVIIGFRTAYPPK